VHSTWFEDVFDTPILDFESPVHDNECLVTAMVNVARRLVVRKRIEGPFLDDKCTHLDNVAKKGSSGLATR
jgi:hypothetical protein